MIELSYAKPTSNHLSSCLFFKKWQTTKHILDIYEKSPKLESFSPATMAVTTADDDTVAPLPPPVKKHVERLNELATAKLAEIVRRAGARAGREKGWEGYEWGELKAARELLDG